MPTPSSGTISFTDVKNELGNTGSVSLSDFYASGPYVQLGTPASGTIKLSDLYSKDIDSNAYTSNSNVQGWNPTQSVSNFQYIPSCWAYIDLYAPDTSTNTIRMGFFCGTTAASSTTTYAYTTYIDTPNNDKDGATWYFRYFYGHANSETNSNTSSTITSTMNGASDPTPVSDGYNAFTWYNLNGYKRLKWEAEYSGPNTGTGRVFQDINTQGVTVEFRAQWTANGGGNVTITKELDGYGPGGFGFHGDSVNLMASYGVHGPL